MYMLSLSLTLNLLLIKLRCLLADELMLSMCLFHFRSDWIVTPRYFVEDSVWRVLYVDHGVRTLFVMHRVFLSCYVHD